MDIYIDETNLESFLSQKEHALFPDVLKLLKQQLNINFNFSKNRLKENEKLSAIIPTLTSGVADTDTTFDNEFPNRPLKTNSAIHFNPEQLSSIYWIDDADGYKLLEAGSVLIALLGEEINETKKLFFNQDDYVFHKRWRIGEVGFQNWNDLRTFSLPLTDIIIGDPYILSKKNGDDTIHNLYEAIDVLTNLSFNKVRIVLFANPDFISYDLDDVVKELKKVLNHSTGKSCSVTIIKTSKEHDRTIITNYKRLKAGDSFTFWNNQGILLSKGKELDYESLCHNENYKYLKLRINDFQKILDFTKENNPDNIIGDKVSGFLNF